MKSVTRYAACVTLFWANLSSAGLSWAGQAELQQNIEFKWRGIVVATMSFDVVIPTDDLRADAIPTSGETEQDAAAQALGPAFQPQRQIKIVGETKGPLSWIEDYQATVSYVQLNATDTRNALLLSGEDNSAPERRDILFSDSHLPQIRLFEDSTAPQALAPEVNWLGNTFNPLGIFKKMLMAAAERQKCESEIWGFDGKRRYLLRLQDLNGGLTQHPNRGDSLTNGNAEAIYPQEYACKITMSAAGRQSASSGGKEPSFVARRLAALWPFGGGDRELDFHLILEKGSGDAAASRIWIKEVRIRTPIGLIIGA